MGVASAICEELGDRTMAELAFSGMSGGVNAALFTVAYPRSRVSSAEFWGHVQSMSEFVSSNGALGLARGMHDCMLRMFIPSLHDGVIERISEQVGVYVHNLDTGSVSSLRGLKSGEDLAVAVAASSTALLFTSKHSHVEAWGSRLNDPAIYSDSKVHKGFRDSGRNVIYLVMDVPTTFASSDKSSNSNSEEVVVDAEVHGSIATIHCVNPADAKWVPALSVPTLAQRRQDFYTGEAWGREHVMPRLRARLAAWGVL
jgi:hypothetical protein